MVSPSLFPVKFSTALVYDLRIWPNCWSFFSDSSLFNLFNIFGWQGYFKKKLFYVYTINAIKFLFYTKLESIYSCVVSGSWSVVRTLDSRLIRLGVSNLPTFDDFCFFIVFVKTNITHSKRVCFCVVLLCFTAI